jgi:hypothetical protein
MDLDDIPSIPALIVVMVVVLIIWAMETATPSKPAAQAAAAEAPARPAAPAIPAEAPARRPHLENAAGQSMEVVDGNGLEEWFKRHLDFKIEHVAPNGSYQVVVVFSKIEKQLRPEAEPGR